MLGLLVHSWTCGVLVARIPFFFFAWPIRSSNIWATSPCKIGLKITLTWNQDWTWRSGCGPWEVGCGPYLVVTCNWSISKFVYGGIEREEEFKFFFCFFFLPEGLKVIGSQQGPQLKIWCTDHRGPQLKTWCTDHRQGSGESPQFHNMRIQDLLLVLLLVIYQKKIILQLRGFRVISNLDVELLWVTVEQVSRPPDPIARLQWFPVLPCLLVTACQGTKWSPLILATPLLSQLEMVSSSPLWSRPNPYPQCLLLLLVG